MNKMNKTYLLIILILYLSVKLTAQPLIGAQFGINISSLSGDKGNDETRMRVGVSPYISLDFPVNYLVTIETGIAYSMQGMKRTSILREDNLVTTTESNIKVDYLLVPVYLKENFTNFYAKIGPYGAYLANATEKWEKSETTSGIITDTKGSTIDFQKSLNPYDVGLSIGFGYIHYLQNKRRRKGMGRRRVTRVMQVDLKYNYGFVPLGDTETNPDFNYKNRVFTIGLSINSIID